MPGITNPAEEYFKDGIWAWAATVWEKLVSSGGRLFTALHGWDGDSWQKLPMLWGYSADYCDALTGEAVAGGNADVTFATVDPGEVWVIESISTDHDAAAAKHLSVRAYNNGCYTLFIDLLTADPNIYHLWVGRVTLPPGGNIFARLYGPGDGKKLNARVWGYKMKIAE